jgi:DNA-binding MarR family transcriptional regulator
MPDRRTPLPRLLAQAFKASRGQVQRRLDALGMHAGQDYLVDVLSEHDGLSVGEVAERLGVEVPTVVRTVQRMEAAGIVAREPDPRDRRRSRIVLTKRGREAEPGVHAALDDVTKTATRGFSREETEQLRSLLERVRTNLTDR